MYELSSSNRRDVNFASVLCFLFGNIVVRYRIHPWETAAAVLVAVLGGLVAWKGSSYGIGSISRLGPGFFPMVLGIFLVVSGVLLLVEASRSTAKMPPLAVRPTLMVLTGMLSFAILVESFGLIPATFSLVILCSLGERESRPLTIAGTAAFLSVSGGLLFLEGFDLPLPAVNW